MYDEYLEYFSKYITTPQDINKILDYINDANNGDTIESRLRSLLEESEIQKVLSEVTDGK